MARFFGSTNLIRGTVMRGTLAVADALLDVAGPDGPATFTIRPERIVLDESASLRMTVHASAFLGAAVRLRLEREGLALEAHVTPPTAPAAGATVGVELPRADLWRFPGEEPTDARQREPAARD